MAFEEMQLWNGIDSVNGYRLIPLGGEGLTIQQIKKAL
jgi:hypothetical protein